MRARWKKGKEKEEERNFILGPRVSSRIAVRLRRTGALMSTRLCGAELQWAPKFSECRSDRSRRYAATVLWSYPLWPGACILRTWPKARTNLVEDAPRSPNRASGGKISSGS